MMNVASNMRPKQSDNEMSPQGSMKHKRKRWKQRHEIKIQTSNNGHESPHTKAHQLGQN